MRSLLKILRAQVLRDPPFCSFSTDRFDMSFAPDVRSLYPTFCLETKGGAKNSSQF